jgi:hypothetical protein
MIIEARNLPADVLVTSEVEDGALHVYYQEDKEDSDRTWLAIGQLVREHRESVMEQLRGESWGAYARES